MDGERNIGCLTIIVVWALITLPLYSISKAINRLADAQRIEAGTDGTAQPVQPEGREPDGEADAPNPLKDRDHD